MQSIRKVVNLVVGGNNFCFRKEDLERFPDSYFAHFLKDEWRYDKSDDIYIDRDGWLFFYVYSFIVSDSLECRPTTFSVQDLMAIRREADFYNISGMVADCDARIALQLKRLCMNASTCINASSKFTCEPEYSTTISPLLRVLNVAARPVNAATSASKLVFLLPSFGTQSILSNRKSHKSVDVKPSFSREIREKVQKECSVWLDRRDKGMAASQNGIYLYSTGTYCTQRMPMFSAQDRLLKGYMIYIPHTCVYTGGKINARGGGQTMSISKPGDCMCLRAGMKYSVAKVTSGSLVVMEVEIITHDGAAVANPYDAAADRLTFTTSFSRRSGGAISTTNKTALTTALTAELNSYPSGVIICLTTLYPITHSPDPENNHIYTDPDSLQDKDAVLYTALCEHFAVAVVTVFLCRTNPDSVSTTTTTPTTTVTTATTASTATTNATTTAAAANTDAPMLPLTITSTTR